MIGLRTLGGCISSCPKVYEKANSQINIFKSVEEGIPDPIFGIVELFKKDKSAEKVNLSIGVYRTAEGKSHVFKAIRKAEEEVVKNEIEKEYATYSGNPLFLKQAKELVFGQGAKIVDRVSLYMKE